MTFTLSPSRILLALLAISPVLGADRVAQAWYAGWHSGDLPPSKVSWSKYTHMTYAFAIPQEDWTVLSLNKSNGPDGLTAFVKEAKAHNVKALTTIGGWTGSIHISSAVGSPQNRTKFVKAVTDFATKFELDGIDMDWEYPNRQGLSCNVINPDDTANLISFLEELRAHPVGSKLILTAATSIQPYNGKDGKPSTDLSKFGKALDWMTIMVYDIWGPWSSAVGANGPLNDTCAEPADQQGSGVGAVDAWTKAGVPHEKILFGLPGYGHGYTVRKKDAFVKGSDKKLAPYPPFDANDRPKGDKWDDPAGVDPCGVATPVGGIFAYRGLIEEGYLWEDGTPKFPHRFDQCSKGAFVYNPDKEIMVAYDSAKSFSAKGEYIKSAGLRGFAIWEAADDYNDTLLDAVRHGVGM